MSTARPRREFTVSAPSCRRLVGWERGPEDGPPVMLLHGLTMTSDQVLTTTAELERRNFRVIAYDARGHGRSAPADFPGGYTYDLLLEDLVAVMDQLGIERAVFAGNSMGCHTSLGMALEQPDRVAALAVISPAYDPDDFPNEENVAEADALASALADRGVHGFLDALRLPPGLSRESPTVKAGHALIRRRLEGHDDLEAIGRALVANLRSAPFEALSQLEAIDVPVLVVGTRDELDLRHPFDLARAYARALRGSRFEVEEPGRVPLGWGGRVLTRLVAELAEQAEWNPAGLSVEAGRPYVSGA